MKTRFQDTSQQIYEQWKENPSNVFPVVIKAAAINSFVHSQKNDFHDRSIYMESLPISADKSIRYPNTDAAQVSSNLSPNLAVDHLRASKSSKSSSSGISEKVSEIMELCYVTEKIIALWYRDDASFVLEHAKRLFRGKPNNNYMIFNLSPSENNNDLDIKEYSWPKNTAPTLEILCILCKDIDSWLNTGSNNVVVLHAKGEKERLGIGISAYMNYHNICGGPDQDLDKFGMQQFLSEKIGFMQKPSYQRYLQYFCGLLSGSLKINPSQFYLTQITVKGIPLLEEPNHYVFFKIYEGLSLIHTSKMYSIRNIQKLTIDFNYLRLRGDVLIKCYRDIYSHQDREIMFILQFHTCVIINNVISFPRSDVDIMCNDSRWLSSTLVTLYFTADANGKFQGNEYNIQTNKPSASTTTLLKSQHDRNSQHWYNNNFTNLIVNGNEKLKLSPRLSTNSMKTHNLDYTFGPIDGSLYAVINQNCNAPVSPNSSPALMLSMENRELQTSRISETDLNINQSHGDLDQLLEDMMMSVKSMPEASDIEYGNSSPSLNNNKVYNDVYDFPYLNQHQNKFYNGYSTSPVNNNEEDIPYHARETSQPFSYGATTDMIKHQKLSSPSLVRKALSKNQKLTVDASTMLDPVELEIEKHNANIDSHSFSWLKQQQLKLAAKKDEETLKSNARHETNDLIINELKSFHKIEAAKRKVVSPVESFDMHQRAIQTTPVSPILQRRVTNEYTGSPNRYIKSTHQIEKNENLEHGGITSRPQTPAFPVHPRTPYANNSSSTTTLFASDYTNTLSSDNSSSGNFNYNYSSRSGNNNTNISSFGSDSTADRLTEDHLRMYKTGLPPKSPLSSRKERSILPSAETTEQEYISNKSYSDSADLRHGRIHSPMRNEKNLLKNENYEKQEKSNQYDIKTQEVADVNIKFVRDTSKIWYKPNISREETIALLKNATSGSFIVRDSNTYPGGFGLAIKVATLPTGIGTSTDPSSELVRHFLIEPTTQGVRLKGCVNEPVFSSLSAFIYQHSLIAMGLPCQLVLPELDSDSKLFESMNNTQQILAQGAACNILYLFSMDTESLTGPQAIKKTISILFEQKPLPSAIIVHFKVSTQGITLTDNARKLFFRRHYQMSNISYCNLDSDERCWNINDQGKSISLHRCFGFVARKSSHKSDNQCHIFAELEPEQPATAVVNFVNKIMMETSPCKINIV